MAEQLVSDDAATAERIGRLDDLLEQLESSPGPVAQLALEAISSLAATYGEALARVVRCVSADPQLMAALSDDELVRHLLVVHDLHPESVSRRVERALEQVRPYIRSHGGEVELSGIEGRTVSVRLSGSCTSCSSSTTTLENAVTQAILGMAPELETVRAINEPPAAAAPTLIPVDALLHGPAFADGGRSP